MVTNNLNKELSNSAQFSLHAHFLCSRKLLYHHITRTQKCITLSTPAASYRTRFRHTWGTTGKVMSCNCCPRCHLYMQPMQAFILYEKQNCLSHPRPREPLEPLEKFSHTTITGWLGTCTNTWNSECLAIMHPKPRGRLLSLAMLPMT